MKRKLIAFTLVFTMLASLSLSVAANAASVQPTVEEILNEYHQKAFEAQTQGDRETASTWSHQGGNAKTLEQETVNNLMDVGYDAYYVTTDNYEYLEAELRTDFADLGLNPEGAYIVVIHGDDQEAAASSGGHSTFGFRPEQDQAPDGGNETFFSYTYNGKVYYMRYVTATAADNTSLGMTSQVDLFDEMTPDEMWDALDLYVTFISPLPVVGLLTSTFYDIFSLVLPEIDRTQPLALDYRGATNWTVTYVEIWDSSSSNWRRCASVEYATMRFFVNYTCYDPITNQYEQISESGKHGDEFSKDYNNRETMKYHAALAFEYTPTAGWWDMVEEVTYVYDEEKIITHQRDWLNP